MNSNSSSSAQPGNDIDTTSLLSMALIWIGPMLTIFTLVVSMLCSGAIVLSAYITPDFRIRFKQETLTPFKLIIIVSIFDVLTYFSSLVNYMVSYYAFFTQRSSSSYAPFLSSYYPFYLCLPDLFLNIFQTVSVSYTCLLCALLSRIVTSVDASSSPGCTTRLSALVHVSVLTFVILKTALPFATSGGYGFQDLTARGLPDCGPLGTENAVFDICFVLISMSYMMYTYTKIRREVYRSFQFASAAAFNPLPGHGRAGHVRGHARSNHNNKNKNKNNNNSMNFNIVSNGNNNNNSSSSDHELVAVANRIVPYDHHVNFHACRPDEDQVKSVDNKQYEIFHANPPHSPLSEAPSSSSSSSPSSVDLQSFHLNPISSSSSSLSSSSSSSSSSSLSSPASSSHGVRRLLRSFVLYPVAYFVTYVPTAVFSLFISLMTWDVDRFVFQILYVFVYSQGIWNCVIWFMTTPSARKRMRETLCCKNTQLNTGVV